MLGKIEGGRKRAQQRIRWVDGITDSWTWVWASFGSWWWTGRPGVLQSVGSQRVGHDWAAELTRAIGRWGSQGWKFQLCRSKFCRFNVQPGDCGSCDCVCVSHSAVSNSLWPRGLWPARLLCPWGSPRGILAWITVSRQSLLHLRSSQPRNWTHIAGRFFTVWVIMKVYKVCTWQVLRELILNFLTTDTHKVVTVR